MTRQEANMIILEVIRQEIENYPDLRFSQILFNNGIVMPSSKALGKWDDDYYLEPVEVLKRMAVVTQSRK